MKRRPERRELARIDALGLRIQAVLDEDLQAGEQLKRPCDRGYPDSLGGYCAAAAAAYFFMGGGIAELQPMQRTHRGGSHWWLERRADGKVIDLTLRPNETTRYPYHEGQARGFMQHGYQRPAQRARTIIDRVQRAESDAR
jgi:hypothetical protein